MKEFFYSSSGKEEIPIILENSKVESLFICNQQIILFPHYEIKFTSFIFQSKGEVTSGPLFIFWLIAAICGAPTFR